ncbi:FAD-dependent oxidoreductase [Bradyrhizobium sp. BRP22]|uniref:FAD-dependent oxidoreductase n=1 Tax=Bradyrhizobium sp. BRP22 TaxID=2793821 RepID=UPI001CD2851C|nr:FAD-dependent oxidoreductase [Bradyrhizobium sp. BRP22]MCA1453101.1 FAD-dependent oxidoreductase [Bradyrhizobium sp. BRP22]
MNVRDEYTQSLWMDVPVVEAPSLSGSERADVVVVGSGIAGLSVAYELVSRGRSVIVLDRGSIGSGMTARTTAHLATALDDYYKELVSVRGEECARLYYQSVMASISRAEAIQDLEYIDCDFCRVDGLWVPAPETPSSLLDEELECCQRLGIPVENRQTATPFHSEGMVRSLRFPGQARFHPTKYLAGLARALQRAGAKLYADSCVESIEHKRDEVVVKVSSGHEVRATDVVVATNSPVNLEVAIHTKQAPYRTYVIAAKLPGGVLVDALYWDTLEPYHYVRLQPLSTDEVLVIIGGEDHKSGEADDGEERFAALEHWARARLPDMGAITHRWSGQVMEPTDFVGFIGRSPDEEHVFIVSGDSGQGITNGLVAGILIADLITTGSSAWEDIYSPARKVHKNIGEYISENITPLKNFAEYLSADEIASVERLRPGEGCLVRSGLQKVAACRDQAGQLHLRSASCTHLGCVVHWNSVEQCWDCSCHGSQFAPDGTALNGPAVSPLADLEKPAHHEAAE